MNIIIALVFISLTLVAGGLVFFFSRLLEGDFEHGDRLSLLPLDADDGTKPADPEIPNDNLDHMELNGTRTESDRPPSSE